MWNFLEKNREKVIFGSVAVFLFLLFRFVIPLIYPFVIGALLAAAFTPVIRVLHKKTNIGKGVCALILMTLLILLLVLILGLCGYELIEKGYEIFCDYEKYVGVFEEKAGVCCNWIETQLHLQEGYLMQEMRSGMTRMSNNWQQQMVPDMFEGSVSGVKKMFSVGIFFVFTFLSALLIVKEADEWKEGILAGVKKYVDRIFDFLKIFLGAQIKIISVIAIICLIGFWISGTEGAFSLAILTACMDVLPFVGTGIIIVPLLLWKVVNARYYQAFLLLGTYICCIIAREYLEPKFISAKAGISPVLTLLGIYAGMKILGFSGIILGPLYVLLLQIFYDELIAGKSLDVEGE